MCGRYTLTVTVRDLQEILPALEAIEAIEPRYNIAPTQAVLAVANDAPTRLATFRWGLVPRWAKDPSIGSRLINARAESLGEKPAFREALQRRRCLVLADGFYEWRKLPGGKAKQPVLIRMKDGKPFGFAGLWDEWRDEGGRPLRTCTIVTTDPTPQVRAIHDRMPVIVDPAKFDRWLAPGQVAVEDVKDILGPTSAPLTITPVSTLVNSPANESAACIEPVQDAPEPEPEPPRELDPPPRQGSLF